MSWLCFVSQESVRICQQIQSKVFRRDLFLIGHTWSQSGKHTMNWMNFINGQDLRKCDLKDKPGRNMFSSYNIGVSEMRLDSWRASFSWSTFIVDILGRISAWSCPSPGWMMSSRSRRSWRRSSTRKTWVKPLICCYRCWIILSSASPWPWSGRFQCQGTYHSLGQDKRKLGDPDKDKDWTHS